MPPLRMSEETMRLLGYRAVDEVVQHLATLGERPVGRVPARSSLEDHFGIPVPEGPQAPGKILDEAVSLALDAIVQLDHPRFLAYIPGPSNFVGAVADFLAAGFNVFAGNWSVAPGPAIVEKVTIDWLCRLCGLPDDAGGLFMSGGTMANLAPIHAARIDRLGRLDPAGVVYLSGHANTSIWKGLRFLGIPENRARLVAVDDGHRMITADLAAQVGRDRRRGLRPYCVIATAGTTKTGAVDPLSEIADVCGSNGLWFHVDGAYGVAAVLSARGAALMAGLERADSIALDPHKWWFQPIEAGCVLVRDAATLHRAFRLKVEGLYHSEGALNYFDYGPQLTRGFRALKLWMSLRTFGLDAFRQAVEHGIALAELAQAELSARPHWEVVTKAQLGIVTFRPRVDRGRAEVDALVRSIAASTLGDGYALVLTAELDGRPVLRFCITNPETTADDVAAVIDRLERLGNWPPSPR